MDYSGIIDKLNSELKGVHLMAVSKMHTFAEVMSVYDAGIRLFGENHVQEIVEKFSNGRPSDMELHMIGHLQSNKVSKVVGLVDMIESVDSVSLLEKIDTACKRINKVMPVLLELNTSGEESKSGFATVEDLEDAVEYSAKLANVKICGLMTIGPVSCEPSDKERLTRQSFRQLKKVFDRYPQFSVLSMGMSQDYMIAVEEGSTQVRIGTMIFGKREYA